MMIRCSLFAIAGFLLCAQPVGATTSEKDSGKEPVAIEVEAHQLKSTDDPPRPNCLLARIEAADGQEEGRVLVLEEDAQEIGIVESLDAQFGEIEIEQPHAPQQEANGRRSPALAFGMSALVPGLGQAYNKSWIRAAVAATLEVALWTSSISWRGQGNDGVELYEAFAQRDWSPARYAEFLNLYPGYTGDAINTSGLDGIDFTNSENWTGEQQTRVNAFFEELRAAERESRYVNGDGTGTGATFSHTLHTFGHQQYYELIGKYYQYGPGWSDWCDGRASDDPSCFTIEGFEDRAQFATKTDLFFDYASDHADANSLLRRASRMTSVIVANHALAALDAFLTARYHNRSIDMETSVSLRTDAYGNASPVANVSFRF